MPEDEDAVAGAPCGACGTLRRRCVPRCVFAAYFSAEEFAAVHGVFGASNVSKMLEDIELPDQRRLASDMLVEEARAWARDPTFDRVSDLRILQEQIEVDDAREEFGSEVASEPVDVAAAGPAARMEARAQVDAALKHARVQDYRLLGGWGAMTQLAGATGEQHLVAQHAENEHGIILGHGYPAGLSQEILQLLELLDMAELSRKQQIIQKTEMGQYWDAAAGAAREQDLVVTMMQQAPAAAWQHQYPAPQYAGIRGGFQEIPQLMEEACTAEFATRMGIMSQQFPSAQPYHDPAAVRHASPWLQHMAEAQQPAAAWQVAREQDMLQLLQQYEVAVAGLMSAGARPFDNVAAQHDDTEVTLGYGYGHPDMHQQVAAAGQVAGVHDMNARHAAAAVLAELEMTQQLAAGAQHTQQGLDIALGNGHLDGETEAMLQELAALLEQAGKQETIRKQGGVTAGMGQWDAVAGIAREQDVTTMTQQSPDAAAWLQVQEMLEQMEEASSTPEFAERLEIIARQAEARYAQDQEELGITLGNGHPDWSTQGMLQAQELFAMAEVARKQEMIRNQVAVAALAREQEMIAQQQHPVAQYSGTELDISLWHGPGHGHGHPYWHQPTMQQMLQEKQLPTVQQLLQEQHLADVVGFSRHQPNTTLVPQVAAYSNGEHGSGTGAAMAFQSPGSAKDAPFPLYVG